MADWLREATAQLTAVSDTARLDAELLAAHALGIEREALLLALRDLAVPKGAAALLARRRAGEPVAHIVGWRDFWTLRLAVTPDVLIPRPDSETLIEVARAHYADRTPPARILDLGTGSGALLLAALCVWPDATGLGIDISSKALAIAEDNARAHGLRARAAFRRGNWADGLKEAFDLVLCNPPYVAQDDPLADEAARHDPHGALFGGPDGLDAYGVLAPRLDSILAPGGLALFEIGHDQGETAAAIFRNHGWRAVCHGDLGGRDRCLAISNAPARV